MKNRFSTRVLYSFSGIKFLFVRTKRQTNRKVGEDLAQVSRNYFSMMGSMYQQMHPDLIICPISFNSDDNDVVFVDEEKQKTGTVMKAKFLHFHQNYRPAYYGTWRKSSKYIKPRKPLAQDTVIKLFQTLTFKTNVR